MNRESFSRRLYVGLSWIGTSGVSQAADRALPETQISRPSNRRVCFS
ncbi:hypothetical protein AAFN60_07000 [Roseibacillus persicicus]